MKGDHMARLIVMRFLMIAMLAMIVPVAMAQEGSELALEQRPFAIHSAFWPNLHHVLWAEAWAKRSTSERSPAGALPEPLKANLSKDERTAWDAAVAYYDREMADLHPLFEMGPIRKFLIAVKGDLPATGLEPAHRQALVAAAPVYRKYWWPAHDRANRAWLTDPMAKVASLSPAVPERLSKLYGTPWFTSIVRVDVVWVGNREGAYASIDPPPAHITISSSDSNHTGWTAAETLFHESSHALVRPILEAFAAELRAQGKASRDLWHVALFYMTGEVVRQALAERGITYVPYLYKTGLFDRAWPHYKAPIETHWKAYVNGEISRDAAIKNIVSAIK
jgi:hypothetical protein